MGYYRVIVQYTTFEIDRKSDLMIPLWNCYNSVSVRNETSVTMTA